MNKKQKTFFWKNHSVNNLRGWLNPADRTIGAYLLYGGVGPCCGGACSVGIGGEVVWGGVATSLSRLFRLVQKKSRELIITIPL